MSDAFDKDVFHDYVIAHGHGAPNSDGYALGKELFDSNDAEMGGHYAGCAVEVVQRAECIYVEADDE